MKHWIVWLNSPASNETLDYIGARLKCRVVLALTVALARQDAHLHSPPWISFLANRITPPDQRQCPERDTRFCGQVWSCNKQHGHCKICTVVTENPFVGVSIEPCHWNPRIRSAAARIVRKTLVRLCVVSIRGCLLISLPTNLGWMNSNKPEQQLCSSCRPASPWFTIR